MEEKIVKSVQIFLVRFKIKNLRNPWIEASFNNKQLRYQTNITSVIRWKN